MWKFLLRLRRRQLISRLRRRQLISRLRPRRRGNLGAISVLALAILFLAPSSARAFNPETLVFIGSSSVELWATLAQDFKPTPVLNLGVGGTTYNYLVQHAAGYATLYPARRFVAYSGDNDLELGIPPAKIAEQFQQLAAILHAQIPDITLYVISIKPSPSRRKNIPNTIEANDLLRSAAANLGYVKFVNIAPLMTDSNGEPLTNLFQKDGLHLNEQGYAIWAKALRAAL